MLKYPCLVLDHDDTAVKSEIAVNYPCFLDSLKKFRPGETMDYPEFVDWCFRYEFTEFLRIRYQFTEEELLEEYHMWQEYSRTRIPPAYEGIRELIYEQKKRGGLVCVASLSSREIILRDYMTHFGMEPDLIFSCSDPREQRKPNPYPLEQIMAHYSLSPDQLLMVDDLPTGYQMASRAGVATAFAAWSRQASPAVMEAMSNLCDFTFHSTENLRKFLFD
jgi:phosphoglycolate phosphatase/pyrophosphatase PpaX